MNIKSYPACLECGSVRPERFGHFAECSRFLIDATEHEPAARGEWRKVYDGPSRPMIETSDGRLLSLSQFEGGRWISYEQEDSDIDAICHTHNSHTTLVEQRDRLREALLAALNSLSRTVRKSYPGYPEEQMQISPTMTLADARQLLNEQERR